MDRGNVVLVNYSLKSGGTERFFSELANYLSKEGYCVTIILLKKDKIFFDLDEQINIIEPDFESKDQILAKFLYFLRLIPFLRITLRILRPSIILDAAFPFYFMSATSGIRVPVILTIRCDPRITKMIEGLKIPQWIRRPMYNRSSVIVAQTSFAANVISQQFQKPKVIAIPNILGQLPVLKYHRENKIISAGRLIKSKGFDYLIKSFSMINARDWKLLILGEGPEEEYLRDLVFSMRLNNRVTITGFKPDIYKYFTRSKIFAFTSLTEGFPNVLLEAMATPLACISYDIDSGPREIITDGENGFLVKPMDVNEFASKLMILINNTDLRNKFMEQAVRVRETHAWEKIGHQYIELIDSVKC